MAAHFWSTIEYSHRVPASIFVEIILWEFTPESEYEFSLSVEISRLRSCQRHHAYDYNSAQDNRPQHEALKVITREFVGFIPRSFVLRSIVLGWIIGLFCFVRQLKLPKHANLLFLKIYPHLVKILQTDYCFIMKLYSCISLYMKHFSCKWK